jgi:TolB-like protein
VGGVEDLLSRLRRRKIVQWALAYGATAFAVLQAVDIVAQRFGWPDAIERGLIVVLIVGFFVTMVLAWYHGERGVQRVNGTELVILALLLGIGGGLLWRFAENARASATAEANATASAGLTAQPAADVPADDKSIAVLPFANLSEEKSNAYFAEGMQDEILTRLAQVRSLRVISRTSTQQFASKPENLTDIARRLGVANILEGSVQKAANRVRINVQLIRASGDAHLWAQTYDRTLDDIFGVQGEVSKAIADALGAQLSGAERDQVATIPTRSEAAYDAWLRALAFYGSGFESEFYQKSAEALRQAVAADPDFAQAWALLARVEGIEYFFGVERTARHLAAIDAALANAERLAPDLYETKLARAYYVYRVEERYPEAQKRFEALHERRPADTEVIIALGFLNTRQGRIDAGDAYIDQAIALEPLNVRLYKLKVASALYANRPAEAIKVAERIEQIQPGEHEVIQWRANADMMQGDLARAGEVLDLAKSSPSGNWVRYIELLRLKHDYAPAIAWLQARSDGAGEFAPEDIVAVRLCLADMKRFAGDAAGAKADYQRAKNAADAVLVEQGSNAVVLTALALTEAALGDSKGAFAALDRNVAEVDKTGDAIDRGRDLDTRARVNARLGRTNESIEALRKAMIAYYGGAACTQRVSAASLRLDPEFDALRDDARFKVLTTANARSSP